MFSTRATLVSTPNGRESICTHRHEYPKGFQCPRSSTQRLFEVDEPTNQLSSTSPRPRHKNTQSEERCNIWLVESQTSSGQRTALGAKRAQTTTYRVVTMSPISQFGLILWVCQNPSVILSTALMSKLQLPSDHTRCPLL